jgi:hypothetical protein
MRLRKVLFGTALLALLQTGGTAEGAMVDWPRRIGLPGGRAVLYEPKVEKHDGNEIEAVAAVSMLIGDATAPVLGSVRFAGRVLAEQDSGMATLEIKQVMGTDFPPVPGAGGINPGALARSEMPRWNIPITVENYHALLSSARAGRALVGNGTETAKPLERDLPQSPFPDYSGLTIMTSVHPKAEFPRSGTFDIRSIRIPPDMQDGKSAGDSVRKALIGQLAGKGYRHDPNSGSPEFLVNANLSFGEPEEESKGAASLPPAGILSLEIRDPHSGRRLWRGTAEGRVFSGSGEERTRRFDFIVGRMLAGFPPKPREDLTAATAE